eukprot:TRINITY_DN22383_c0_g1_i1.p1 TRINITY_DN22383_c0_g1~~TRINITY_DN22383_c0_g1_i1.p1  ORF type:complete len:432 (-),score=47.37 TRINITY_DN22383_c0_g1_i1:185-1480(-)
MGAERAAVGLRQPLLAKNGSAAKRAAPPQPNGWLSEGSVSAAVALLCSAAIGTGVLALPYGVSQVGVVPATFLFALAGACSFVTNIILFRCVRKTGHGSYGELMTGILGQRGALVLDLFVCVEGLGSVATYLVFIMDYVPQVCSLAGDDVWCTDRTNVLMAAALIVWPLSCFEGLSMLRYTSTCSIVTIVLTSAVVLYRSPGCFARSGRDFGELVAQTNVSADGFQVLSMACFAFMTHTNTPEIALGLRNGSRRDAGRTVVGVHTGLLWAVYSAIGICGFLSYPDNTHQDFLTHYEVRDFLVVVCRCLLSATLVLACPMNIFPAMQSLFNIVEAQRPPALGKQRAPLYRDRTMRVPVTTACFALALGVALRTPRVADLISVISSFLSSPLMFAFPAVMYWRILGGRSVVLPAALLILTLALWLAEILRILN